MNYRHIGSCSSSLSPPPRVRMSSPTPLRLRIGTTRNVTANSIASRPVQAAACTAGRELTCPSVSVRVGHYGACMHTRQGNLYKDVRWTVCSSYVRAPATGGLRRTRAHLAVWPLFRAPLDDSGWRSGFVVIQLNYQARPRRRFRTALPKTLTLVRHGAGTASCPLQDPGRRCGEWLVNRFKHCNSQARCSCHAGLDPKRDAHHANQQRSSRGVDATVAQVDYSHQQCTSLRPTERR